jgi:hypothetical protein
MFGLVLGLLGAAGVLLWASWGNGHRTCDFPDTEECTLELDAGTELARLEGLAAIGCACLAGAAFLLARRGAK